MAPIFYTREYANSLMNNCFDKLYDYLLDHETEFTKENTITAIHNGIKQPLYSKDIISIAQLLYRRTHEGRQL